MVAGVLLFGAVVFAALYREVSREGRTREQTATPEMWDRSIEHYTNEMPATVTAVTGNESNRGQLRSHATPKNTRAAKD